MLATGHPITTPSPAVAAILIAGEGLALVSAYLFMAATFERNISVGLRKPFTRWAAGIACISTAVLVVGTIETLAINYMAVTIMLLIIAVLIVVTLAVSLFLSRVPCIKVKRNKKVGDVSPDGVNASEKHGPIPERVEESAPEVQS